MKPCTCVNPTDEEYFCQCNLEEDIMDITTIEHLTKWIEHEFYPINRDDEEFSICIAGMKKIVAEDPEYWTEKGWSLVYCELRDREATF